MNGSAFILDASVAAKWVLPSEYEDLVPQAAWVRSQYDEGKMHLLVPDLFWPEMGNVLWRNVRKKRISRQHAADAMNVLLAKRLESVPTARLMTDAIEHACTYDRSVYDCVYLALTVTSGLPLLTADVKLVNAMGRYFPIRWLGSAW